MKKIYFVIMISIANLLYGQQTIKNLQWLNIDQEIADATVGDGVTLFAETKNIEDGELVKISIWELGDENDDFVGDYISRVYESKIKFHWSVRFEENELPQSLSEIERNGITKPQYYFMVQYKTIKTHNSGMLNIKGWTMTRFVDDNDKPQPNVRYKIYTADGSSIEGWTDAEGYAWHRDIPIGNTRMRPFDSNGEYHEVEPAYQDPENPIYYKVKRNDSFWKIAGYAFIYSDPNLWKILYEANKNNLLDEKNPDLVEEGQTLIIPSISGEIRRGIRFLD